MKFDIEMHSLKFTMLNLYCTFVFFLVIISCFSASQSYCFLLYFNILGLKLFFESLWIAAGDVSSLMIPA